MYTYTHIHAYISLSLYIYIYIYIYIQKHTYVDITGGDAPAALPCEPSRCPRARIFQGQQCWSHRGLTP